MIIRKEIESSTKKRPLKEEKKDEQPLLLRTISREGKSRVGGGCMWS